MKDQARILLVALALPALVLPTPGASSGSASRRSAEEQHFPDSGLPPEPQRWYPGAVVKLPQSRPADPMSSTARKAAKKGFLFLRLTQEELLDQNLFDLEGSTIRFVPLVSVKGR